MLSDREMRPMHVSELRRACRKRGLPSGGKEFEVRKRLQRFSLRVLALRCPVCLEVPAEEEVLLVCNAGHHMCFGCVLGLYRQRPALRRCPLRCPAMAVRPPGQLCRELLRREHDELPAGLRRDPPELLRMYRALHQPGVYFEAPIFSHQSLGAFARMTRTPGDPQMAALERYLQKLDEAQRLRAEIAAARAAVRRLQDQQRPADSSGSGSSDGSDSSDSDTDSEGGSDSGGGSDIIPAPG